MSAASHLRLVRVDDATGEITDADSRDLAELQAKAEKLEGDVKNLEKDLRAKRRRITELERDKARERLEHPHRELIVRVCRYWWRKCRGENPRVNPLTPERFDAVALLVSMEEITMEDVPGRKRRRKRRKWLFEMRDFKAAIDGAAFDPYSRTNKNGKVVRYDDLTTIFKGADALGQHRDKAPYDWRSLSLPLRVPPGVVVHDPPLPLVGSVGPGAAPVGGPGSPSVA